MYQEVYYMGKESNTYADTLAAYGMAAVLDEVLARTRGRIRHHQVTLRDMGAYYEISFVGAPLREEEVERCDFFAAPGATGFYITKGGSKGKVPSGASSRDVDATWDEVKQHAAHRSALWDEGIRGTDLENQLRDREPPPDWAIVTWLGDSRMQASGIYNRLIEQWCQRREHFTTNLKTLLAMAATPEPDLDAIAVRWGKATGYTRKSERTITSSQLFNPHQGKGLNEPKANRLKMDNIKDDFWLSGYLKACGLWLVAAPRQADKERKTYVLNPLNLTLKDHSGVFREFARRLWHQPQRDTTTIKLDITSVLLYLQTLLEYSEAGQKDEDEFGLAFDADFGPEQVVSGMHIVQYKLLSQKAYTVTHIGFLGLPRWTKGAKDREDVYALKGVIEEHLRVIQGIDENKSDGYDLLRRYRDFVAGGQWGAFFDFAVGYSHYLMRARHEAYSQRQKPKVWQFSESKLEELMSKAKTNLLPIVQNQGFKEIARAIRQSTVQAQYWRYEKNDKRYDVRYGLGQELAQKAHDATEFAIALGKFLGHYSAESAQVREKAAREHKGNIPAEVQKKLRGRVSDEAIEDLLSLIPEFGSEVVCHLLVAVGYAHSASSYDKNDSNDDNGD